MGGIGWRLSHLQLIQGEINRQKATKNRIRIVPKPPVRGNIFDRQGRILASSRQSYSAYLWPKSQKNANWQKNRDLIAQILEITPASLQKKVEEAEEKAKADPGKPSTFLVHDRLRRGGKLLKPGQTVRMSGKDAAPLIALGVLEDADDD